MIINLKPRGMYIIGNKERSVSEPYNPEKMDYEIRKHKK